MAFLHFRVLNIKTLILAFFCLAVAAQAQTRLANGVAVIVNQSVITYKQIYNELAAQIDTLEKVYRNQPETLQQKITQLEKEQIDSLVANQLVLDEYKTAGYNVPESYIESKINEEIKDFGDRATLTKTLQAQGRTYEAHRKRIRDRVILDLMWAHHVPRDPVISPFKIEQYYKNNPEKFQSGEAAVLRIFFLSKRDREEAAKRMIQEVQTKLKEGVDFGEMAAVYSQQSTAAPQEYERTKLRPELADVAFKLKQGEISEVIDTPEGYYILKAEEMRAARVKPLSEVREEIEETLKDDERNRLRQKWIERLKEKSFVRYF